MAITQIGYAGNIGPVFRDDSPGGGMYIILQGQTWSNGVSGLYAKQPGYATNLGLSASIYTLGSYADNQRVSDIPAFKQPVSGPSFSGYDSNVAAMVTATTIPGSATITSTTTSTGTTTTSTGTTSAGTTDTTFSAPTLMEQVTTFLTNYWWLVALILLALLWKPFIAPFLGMGKKRRR
ncbi:hypothetical protein GO755_32870 [Spirosoma sp. HMF4905]|uniref:Uncharacterized protein n=1 Tax=Spirosoma arboris TaxID=2682092 RepID=A0A7K1SM71_9BACT|nr:hypothetical protein [Spirosoma arboris]MVM34868.1 hypothetical protein [Spirosoma arboris]